MEPNQNFDFDRDFDDQQPFFGSKNSPKNDSVGNNSGGVRSQRDEDFDLLDDQYEKKIQHKMELQNLHQLVENGQVVQIGPQNNPSLGNKSNKHPEISFYDIESNLSAKNVSILNFKKTLQTISQYLNAFQLDELIKFIKLIMDLPVFDETFEKQNRKNLKMQIERNQFDQVSSDLSAKSDSGYKLPCSGIQTIFEIVNFLTDLIDKCSQLDNTHLIPLLRQMLNTQSRFFNLPLKPEQLITENTQFVQNSNNQERYQQIEEGIQNSYVGLFEFSDEVNSLKQIWYFYFASRCINNCFKKDSKQYNLSTKMKIHCIKILNQLNQCSHQMFTKFKFSQEEENYVIDEKGDILKMQKQQLEDYLNAMFDFSHKDPNKISLYLSFLISTLVNDQNSIEKKSLALKLIDKLILNTKLYAETIDTVSQILEKHAILDYFLKDQTHSQLLRKLPPIVKFLYELQKIQVEFVKKLIKDAMKGHEEFFKVVQSILQYLKLPHLEEIFEFIKGLLTKQTDLLNSHTVGLIQSIVGNSNLASNKKKKKHPKKEQTQMRNQHELTEHKINHVSENLSPQEHPLVYELFGFLYKLVQDPKFQNLYIPILCKHISLQISFILPILQQQLTVRLSKPKHYESFVISILDYCLKIDMDSASTDFHQKKKIVEQKQEKIKYQFINNLVTNCNLYDSIFFMLCKRRFDKIITQKCLNILILVTKSYKPLEKGQIELLWKILGVHSSNQFQKQQFFQFIKEILKSSINLSEESIKHIYFQIILKFHYEWFTPKIYDCFEMLFMRLNEDGKLLTYEYQNNNSQNPTYHLNQTQLIGIQKLYYLYLWSDQKVSKKIKDFLYKLYSYKSSPQTKQKLSFQYIQAILGYIKRNPQREDHILHAQLKTDYEQHVNRAFQFFSKFVDGSFKQNGDQNSSEQNVITINIHNVTKQALPPVKKSIQVNRNMILKDFKDLIRKQINPQITDIDLINKGKPLKVEKMSLKQLKIGNNNTILVQNLDVPAPKKQIEQQKLKQCKQTLQCIFGEQHPTEILDYVAEKYMGEQLEKICEWIMDEEKIKEIESQMKTKNSCKMEQQRDIISNKKNQNEIQILSFAEILSKQIDLLLSVIQSNPAQQNRDIVEKQWTVIRKIPANIEIVNFIERQLEQQIIHFSNIFQLSQSRSLNMESYIWFLLRRVLSKRDDQSKKKIIFQKNLETFIVDKLQTLIQNQVFNHELYLEIIETHQLIIQGLSKSDQNRNKISLFDILNEGQNDKNESFSSINILNEISLTIQKCKNQFTAFNFVQFKDKYKTYEKLFKMLVSYPVDDKIASKVLGFLLFNLISPENRSFGSVQQNLSVLLGKDDLYTLILSYRKAFLRFYLSLFVLESSRSNHQYQPNTQQIEIYTQNYSNLRSFIYQNQPHISLSALQRGTKEWLYFLLIGYIDLISLYEQKNNVTIGANVFEEDLLNWIRRLTEKYVSLSKNQLVGIMALINKLNEKVLHASQSNNLNFVQNNLDELQNFVEFLTRNFIFQLKGVPILTEQVIKQQYYLILLKLSGSRNDLLLQIAQKIIKFGVQKRNHDHDNIDFRKNQFVGIQNLGCTCYINSLIQQLYHTRLPYKLLALSNQQGLFQLNHTFMQLYMSTKNAINIRPMIQQVKFYGQQIIPNIQQDVQEFLISLLDYIESCNGRSIIDSIFGGSYSEELTYFSERQEDKIFKKHKQQHFYNITLDIKGKKTLNQALVYFFRSQTLDDKIFCQELQERTSAVKRSFIKHFPKILIFTLKRFEFDVENMVRNKLNDYLQFPMELDLTQFSLDKFLSDEKNKQKIEIQRQSEKESHFYTLCGILIHSGSAQTGHYYSYIQRENKWYEFNDRIVTEMNIGQKIKGQCFGGGDSKSRNAYMLFYERKQRKNDEDRPRLQKIEKMQIEEQESAMEEQLEKTIPLQDEQEDESQHHGVFLSKISDDNYLKQLVLQENHHFIKERLIYDSQYRKFVQHMIEQIRQAKQRNPYQTQSDKRQEYLLSEKLVQIEKINQIINPISLKPVVHFVSNQMMEVQELKQITYEEEQRLDEQRRKQQRQGDIVVDLLNENPQNDFI